MILTFEEIGIDRVNYNGVTAQHAEALIMNQAIDYVMKWHFYHYVESAVMKDYKGTVDFLNGTITLNVIKPYWDH